MMCLRTGLLGLSGVVFALLSTFSHATRFDCVKASTFAEIQICKSPQLQQQDELLNSTYVEALSFAQDKARLRAVQRSWLKQRDACSTVECVSRAMDSRTKTIRNSAIPAEPSRVQQKPTAPTVASSPQIKPVPATRYDLTQDVSGQNPQQSVTTPSDSVSQAQTSSSNSERQTADDPHVLRPFKIALLVMGVLLIICIWLHSRGSMVIYSCYTDALWTTMTPFLACAAYLLGSWLELPTQTAQITAAVVFGLMLLQVIIQTFRHNGFSIFFILALYAKLLLFIIYFLSMAVLIFGGAKTAAQRRRQRNLVLGGSVLFALLTGWMTRTRSFSHIDDYLAGRT